MVQGFDNIKLVFAFSFYDTLKSNAEYIEN